MCIRDRVIALLLLRRLLQSVKRQRLMALDVKQAQEVQQVILPEARLALPGLNIESEYRPAREVGGDFFQVLPSATDGSVLIVVGDVAGHGLKSGMLATLIDVYKRQLPGRSLPLRTAATCGAAGCARAAGALGP